MARQSTSKLLEDLALKPVPPLASIAESAGLGAGAAGGDAAMATSVVATASASTLAARTILD